LIRPKPGAAAAETLLPGQALLQPGA
jgi:hypothetical protein